MDGLCHNGLSKIFGNNGDALSAWSHPAIKIDYVDEHADSSLFSRLKRPPRA